MRDPLGTLALGTTSVFRKLKEPLPASHFLLAPISKSLVDTGKLVPFVIEGTQIESPRIPFVTYPYEWCDSQFLDAANLTLDISRIIFEAGYQLKDASAWNVLFEGNRPVFCDHLSFERAANHEWWAFGQFARHFVFPLYLSKLRSTPANSAFLLSRDGLSAKQARHLLGASRYLSRVWPLLIESGFDPAQAKTRKGNAAKSPHEGLFRLLDWLMHGLGQARARDSAWRDYTTSRPHYSEAATEAKLRAVDEWLRRLQPSWVTDLGCNTGEYSLLAERTGATVVGLDSDIGAIETLYRSRRSKQLYPVLANLDDLSAGRGWAGIETRSLVQRLEERTDTLLMLAITHHLAISCSIPFDEIAKLASKIARKHLILEIISQDDPIVRRLASERNRDPAEFGSTLQVESFMRYFDIADEQHLEGGFRSLLLLSKRD